MQTIAIAPYLNVLVVDASDLFRERLGVILRALDFRTVLATASASRAVGMVEAGILDLVFIETDERYRDVWAALATASGRRCLVVGVCERAPTERYDADAIVARQLYPSLLRSMLAHLYASPAARRGRVVPFRARPRGGPLTTAEPAMRASLPTYPSPPSMRTGSSV